MKELTFVMVLILTLNSKWAFSGLLTDGEGRGAKRLPLPKIPHKYPAMIKLGTVIPYLKKIQTIYESRTHPLSSVAISIFFNGNQEILLYQKMQI